ncbi:serine carboxypeptidase 1-like protein [Carex littledalei]|uniref:Carboxypeptidase n=1 Tax=Carex littledalei TaxID=544730 RepID=A0A833QQF9_9POAL|nr:serine carboxypeptidase 1-like protein [Carex littledalei]
MAFFAPLCFVVFFVTALASISAAPQSHFISQLPGFSGSLPSNHYSGYITVDEEHGRNLFYYLVISEGNPAVDPVVLWMNGGPGCSSFDGFVYENGPFNFEAGNTSGGLPKLHLNPYSWSKVSSIIYLDSPAGTGLSYSLDHSDYTTGDIKTAADSHKFLLKWFELYPEFTDNPFYISGESYAGVYIPTLAAEVVKGITEGVKPVINFKGYLIGNGFTDMKYDGNSFVPFAHGMGLISEDMYEEVHTVCAGSYYMNANEACQGKIAEVRLELKDLNKYHILEPCFHSPEQQEAEFVESQLPPSFRKLGETERPLRVRKRMFGRAWPLNLMVQQGRVPTWPELGRSLPCTSDEIASSWLNNQAVRSAIHAETINITGPWELYTAKIDFTHDTGSMLEYHKNLTTQGYRALIYSGDHDLCIPFTGTEAWTRELGYKTIDKWRPWFFNDQVAGYVRGYDHNLTFMTVKGSGHAVPEYKPKEALAFYRRWLSGTTI